MRHYDSSTDETEKDTPKKIKPNKGNKELVAAPKPPSLPVPSPLVAANDMSSDEDTVLKINDNNTTKEQYLDTLQTLLPSSSLPSLTLNSVEKEPLTLIATPKSREKEPQVTPINSQVKHIFQMLSAFLINFYVTLIHWCKIESVLLNLDL